MIKIYIHNISLTFLMNHSDYTNDNEIYKLKYYEPFNDANDTKITMKHLNS